MASDADATEEEENLDDEADANIGNGKMEATQGAKGDETDEEEEEEEEDADEEPRLKYASVTKQLAPIYRHGDATSAFLVAGDKMIIGTHNGNIHVLSLPSLAPIKSYRAHTASVSAVSISPFPPPIPATKGEGTSKAPHEISSPTPSASRAKVSSPPGKSPKAPPVPLTASNYIYIASSSIDGNVCVSSLTDPKDVTLRNFGRPVQSVSLSPDFRYDHSYLSGGKSGNLILTVGAKLGTSSTSNAGAGPAAAASGWLGAIGLGTNTGKDTIVHSGEGAVRTIKWSLSGKFVVWVNEKGIKVMRSNLHLEPHESDLAWRRLNHIDYPDDPLWEEMAGVWKAQAEWIDESGLESDDFTGISGNTMTEKVGRQPRSKITSTQRNRSERLLVGWGDAIWMFDVHPSGSSFSNGQGTVKAKAGQVEVITILRIDDIVSGVSLYTPSLLLVLSYVTSEEDSNRSADRSKPPKETTKSHPSLPNSSIHRKQNALQPEMRIIDVITKNDVCIADTLTFSRFEGLTAPDYHLGVLPAMQVSTRGAAQRGALEIIGGGIWDMGVYSTRLFSSAASVRSNGSHSRTGSSNPPSDYNIGSSAAPRGAVVHPSALSHGMKIFIHSPYDCVLATKPTLADHFAWLDNHAMYEDAWNLLDRNPEAVNEKSDTSSESLPSTPTQMHVKANDTLGDFLADDNSQTTASSQRYMNSHVEKEKRRTGEQWIQQLVSAKEWEKAGSVSGKVLNTASSWEHWVWVFAQAQKFEEITPYIPSTHVRTPLPSIVYELVLGHYISQDRVRFKEMLDRWPPELFDIRSITEAIRGRLRGGDINEESIEDGKLGRDWRILMECLAKLYVADGRPAQALECYIRLQDAEAAMSLVGEHHLVSTVSDDVPSFILLRVSKEQQKSASLPELEQASQEPIRLLVDEAHQGIVRPETVIQQLDSRYGIPNPYLFFYFRALWNGETSSNTQESSIPSTSKIRKQSMMDERLVASEGKSLVSDHADIALRLFAEYDRPLLMTFLKTSQSYTLELASQICKQRSYIQELVYLLSKEGRTNQALRLIIDKLGDVLQAISFVKEQDDQSLWDDLLSYGMNKPAVIRGLLEEAGTSVDPIKLVQSIPEGLEVEGLKKGLMRMIREYELQHSIREGVARVLRGEVAAAMKERETGQRKGFKFDIGEVRRDPLAPSLVALGRKPKVEKGRCPGCGEAFIPEDPHLVLSFPCRHIFHLPCLLTFSQNTQEADVPSVLRDLKVSSEFDRSIGPKVDHAALVKSLIRGGCPLEIEEKE